MLDRLFRKLFGYRSSPEPHPPRPPAPPRGVPPPPPPPPPPAAPRPDAAPAAGSSASAQPAREAPEGNADPAQVKLMLEDGTLTTASLDADSEERLRYILDNMMPPDEGPPP